VADAAKPRLVTLQQLSADLGIPRNSLRDLVFRGVLPVVKFPGSRRWWFLRAAVDRVIAASTETYAPDRGEFVQAGERQ
jgi:hypothetical protein